ncbi:hypothetical protein SLEP1_g11579 [Rubroshorea leprosula]|nr:hypothetical protein SLEP1_g11579 [Rubroshorea leprosula]
MIPFKLSTSHRAVTTTTATITAHHRSPSLTAYLQLQGWVVLFLLSRGHLNCDSVIPFKLSTSHSAVTTTLATLTTHLQLQGWVVLFLLSCGHLNCDSVIPFKLSASHRAITTTTTSLQRLPLTTTHLQLQAFSTSGKVISPHRSKVRPNTIQALMCLQDWLKKDLKGPDNNGNFFNLFEELEENDNVNDESESAMLTTHHRSPLAPRLGRPLSIVAWPPPQQLYLGFFSNSPTPSSDNNENFFNLFEELKENDNVDDESEVMPFFFMKYELVASELVASELVASELDGLA